MIINLVNALGPYAKVVLLAVAYVLALAAQAAGLDLGLDTENLWQQIGAAVVVFLTPAPGYVKSKLPERGV